MRTVHFAIVGLSLMGLVTVGCAADTEEADAEGTGSTSDEVRGTGVAPGYCQSSDGRTVLGTSCHDRAALEAICKRQARPGEEFVGVTPNGLRQDGKWKTATCRIEARRITLRCCDDS